MLRLKTRKNRKESIAYNFFKILPTMLQLSIAVYGNTLGAQYK